jgi:FkbM family methyltransferase
MNRDELRAAFEKAAASVVPLEGLGRAARLKLLKGRYASYLAKRFLAPGSPARLFSGRALLCGRPEHSAALHLFGVLEAPAELKLARHLLGSLKKDDVFFDVGANFGYYSLLAADLVGTEVQAFEPVPWVHELLVKNAAGLKIKAHRLAVSDAPGELSFDEAPPTHPGGSTIDAAACLEPGSKLLDFRRITVTATTLDEFHAKSGLMPTVIKIDVEGAENRVIAGGRKTLGEGSPSVIIEVWKPPVVNKTHHEAIASLRALGYRAHALTDMGGLAPLDDSGIARELSGGETANLVFKKPV